ncbi:hypothetical protein HanHA300_Chr16g0609991 [Helianthus annuus]|nr:hypothetical protein HanHA300_Chr16g0609991 [Helianthus annuus]KAJ0460417.1 hypothetical protein HanHA89_Chr16g0660581 [Helianthus annuus]KAJ0640859.1 hypothetical protein HanLR1_Chr16g0620511 [Helianthus annuus]KAJ0644775.1 hypothetical protein HanOQP8_Chr16g0616141 [Helianthus annuus]
MLCDNRLLSGSGCCEKFKFYQKTYSFRCFSYVCFSIVLHKALIVRRLAGVLRQFRSGSGSCFHAFSVWFWSGSDLILLMVDYSRVFPTQKVYFTQLNIQR